MMRNVIAGIPDGRYSFDDWIDGVGEDPEPLRIAVEVVVEGDGITIDFTGTSEQVQAAVNCPIAMVNSSTYCAIRCLTDREIPNCEGYMRPVKLIVAARHDPQPRAPGGVRGARRHGLPRVRRHHGRAGAGRAGARHRGLRGRPDPVLDRRAAERQAVRADRGDGRHLGRARRRSTASRASPIRPPTSRTIRSN